MNLYQQKIIAGGTSILITGILSGNLQAANASPSPTISQGVFVSHQVNVDANGQNIVNDKANEPTIAVSPTNQNNIVIGWRNFALASSFDKQAGYGYSFDGGKSWNNGVLPSDPEQQRTDPVLDSDTAGNFYYQSMGHGSVNQSSVFKSTDGGITWSNPVDQFLGDKNWLTIDKTNGSGTGNIYSTWRKAGSSHPDPNYVPKYFIRSTDGGVSYQEPDIGLPVINFGFGRIAIASNSDIYLSGIKEDSSTVNSIAIIRGGHYFLKSVNAKDPNVSPTFTAQQVEMGGNTVSLYTQKGPNPLGADGDVQIATDTSAGVMAGNIYMFHYTQSYNWQTGDDPLDVHLIRSEDGGDTWSAPIRVNDDAPAAQSYQYFPMLGVAPNSRLDAVWYDTRNGTGNTPGSISQLFYSYSWDGGVSWSENLAVTPLFNTHQPTRIVNGEERQTDKMGDYTHLISDENGAHLAYSATFNGEQDIYYLNVFPDCNNNGISDVTDINQGTSQDTAANHIPDECETIVLPGDIDTDGDVDKEDMRLVLAARNMPASGTDDPRDLDADGTITVLDARKVRLLCTRPRCATSD